MEAYEEVRHTVSKKGNTATIKKAEKVMADNSRLTESVYNLKYIFTKHRSYLNLSKLAYRDLLVICTH